MAQTISTENTLKALANNRRLSILVFLKKKQDATVGDIAQKINLSFTSTSKHLLVLYRAGLIRRTQKQLFVYYSLNSEMPKYVQQILAKA